MARLVYVTSALLLLALAIVYLVARLWLPTIVDKKPEIEAWLSQKSAHQVRIGQLETFWRGLYPGVRLTGVRVYAGGRTVPAVQLRELHVSLDWIPLLWGEVRIDRLRVVGPQLSFERLKDGRFRVTGFEPVPAGADQADGEVFVDWLFRQRRLEIADGELQWVDHRDPGHVLYFKAVNLTLDNRGDRHRLEFRAAFPGSLCRDCTFVADVRGNPFRHEAWQGHLQLRAVGLDVGALPAILGERLPRGWPASFRSISIRAGAMAWCSRCVATCAPPTCGCRRSAPWRRRWRCARPAAWCVGAHAIPAGHWRSASCGSGWPVTPGRPAVWRWRSPPTAARSNFSGWISAM